MERYSDNPINRTQSHSKRYSDREISLRKHFEALAFFVQRAADGMPGGRNSRFFGSPDFSGTTKDLGVL